MNVSSAIEIENSAMVIVFLLFYGDGLRGERLVYLVSCSAFYIV